MDVQPGENFCKVHHKYASATVRFEVGAGRVVKQLYTVRRIG
jgi:hypothetical protein